MTLRIDGPDPDGFTTITHTWREELSDGRRSGIQTERLALTTKEMNDLGRLLQTLGYPLFHSNPKPSLSE